MERRTVSGVEALLIAAVLATPVVGGVLAARVVDWRTGVAMRPNCDACGRAVGPRGVAVTLWSGANFHGDCAA